MRFILMALSAFVLSSCATYEGMVRSSLLVGRLESIQLMPKKTTFDDKDELIEVSNSCGYATTQFSTVIAIRGKARENYSFYTELDEWCSAPFSLSTEQYLLHVREDGERSELVFAEPIETTNEGRLLIVPNQRILFGDVEFDNYRSPVAVGDYPVDMSRVREIDLERLISRGYVKESGGSLFYTSVVYIDRFPSVK